MPPLPQPPRRPEPITDSPLFWICLFATFAIAAMVAIGPKYSRRQAQIERQFQARRPGQGRTPGSVAPPAPSRSDGSAQQFIDRDRLIHRLEPIYFVLGGIVALAWAGLFWRRRRLLRGGAQGERKSP